ncbi:MAG TPA: dTDP-4-dehydrorhamnose 3,5-epimerase family protein [Candidatus Deferrimicrobium sp.]|nr:dTDP-4-dehydrorhamnose 3,5-epimerase family protein [Candidatus Deferrimicrobium sp.]
MKCDIDGVIVREIKKHDDRRGWLAELFRHDELPPECFPVMSYVSMTRSGVVRGPHEHKYQTDLFCFLGPGMFRLYLWDNRTGSATYGRKCVLEAGEAHPMLVIVPAGVVHAYKNVGTVDGLVFNAPNHLYAGSHRTQPIDEIRHEDDPATPFRIVD